MRFESTAFNVYIELDSYMEKRNIGGLKLEKRFGSQERVWTLSDDIVLMAKNREALMDI